MSDNGDLYPYDQHSPWESYQEALETAALMRSQEPEASIRKIRPPLDIIAFPDRYGYGTPESRTPTIESVLTAVDKVPMPTEGYTGASRNAQSSEPLG